MIIYVYVCVYVGVNVYWSESFKGKSRIKAGLMGQRLCYM